MKFTRLYLSILFLCGSSFGENTVKVSSSDALLNILDLIAIVKTNTTVSIDEMVEIKMLDKLSPMYPEIHKYVMNTQATEIEGAGCWWKYDFVEIFEVRRYEEESSYKPFENSNRMLLLHGSSMKNYIGILKHGLKPPKEYRESYCFGMGIYFGDTILVSGSFTSTTPDGTGFVLIAEVAVGVPEIRVEIDRSPINKEVSDSVQALGKYYPNERHVCPDGLKIPNGKLRLRTEETVVSFNEFIVHDEARVKLRYLVEFKRSKFEQN